MRKPGTTVLRRRGKLQDGQLTILLDLGDRSSFYCVPNGACEVILEERVATNPEAMKKTCEKMPASRIALKTGTHSPWVIENAQGPSSAVPARIAAKKTWTRAFTVDKNLTLR